MQHVVPAAVTEIADDHGAVAAVLQSMPALAEEVRERLDEYRVLSQVSEVAIIVAVVGGEAAANSLLPDLVVWLLVKNSPIGRACYQEIYAPGVQGLHELPRVALRYLLPRDFEQAGWDFGEQSLLRQGREGWVQLEPDAAASFERAGFEGRADAYEGVQDSHPRLREEPDQAGYIAERERRWVLPLDLGFRVSCAQPALSPDADALAHPLASGEVVELVPGRHPVGWRRVRSTLDDAEGFAGCVVDARRRCAPRDGCHAGKGLANRPRRRLPRRRQEPHMTRAQQRRPCVGFEPRGDLRGLRWVNPVSELAAPGLLDPRRSGHASGLGSFCSDSESMRCRRR